MTDQQSRLTHITNVIKHKMRLSEIKKAARSTRDVFLQRIESIIQSNHLIVMAELDDLKIALKKESDRNRRDLDAAIKYRIDALSVQIKKQPSYIAESKFVLFKSALIDLVIPSNDAGLISYIEKHGPDFIEPGTRDVICRLLKPGDVAVDVGANCGIHTIAMSRAVGADGMVYAFEPTPDMAAALRYTATLSGARSVQIIPMVVIDKPKKTKLYSFNHSPENSIFPTFNVESQSISSVDVDACSLDSFFPEGSRVDLVKADVEGAEPLVFKGMQRVIRENANIQIVMEMSPSHFQRSGIDLGDFFAQLTELDFKIYAIDEDTAGLKPVTPSEIEKHETMNVLISRAQF
ncbi:MAG: FkbM family methyltransferase [Candidatus Obscuribacterales bacterium]|nr:FkbM family methyltransferase [Candidatus Obscuribacterales bacterium]